METFTELFGSLLLFVYHCFDRIVINCYPIDPTTFTAGAPPIESLTLCC